MTTNNEDSNGKVNVLMVGTGEYTTGYVGGKAADSDKGAGVVALTMFDLRRRQKVDRVGMCGVNVSKKNVVNRKQKDQSSNMMEE
jgi:D-galacturonate reductase